VPAVLQNIFNAFAKLRWGVLTRLVAISVVSGQTMPWSASPLRNTGISGSGVQTVISPAGELVVVGGSTGACAGATLALGSSSQGSACVSKYSAAGVVEFTVQIGGAALSAVAIDSSGDIVVVGATGIGAASDFETTPGAYLSSPPGYPDPVLCKLSGMDGHPLYCTFTDIGGTALVDAAGNVDLVGTAIGATGPTVVEVEQINATGTAAPVIGSYPVPSGLSGGPIAIDGSGNFYFLYIQTGSEVYNVYVEEMNAAGVMTGSVSFSVSDAVVMGVTLDPAGNPEILIDENTSAGAYRVRKYAAGLSALLFDTEFLAGSPTGVIAMAADSAGGTEILAATGATNVPEVNPTQACVPAAASGGLSLYLVRIDATGNLAQATFLDVGGSNLAAALTPGGPGAYVALSSINSDVTTVSTFTLGPASGTVSLGCVGNAASFVNMPLAPNEIVAAFGANLGPAAGVTAEPDQDGVYPASFGGVEITFDGVAAPILYASSGQVNLITPGSLSGKTSTEVCAVVNGIAQNCFTMAVAATGPGFFLSASGYAAAVNQDGTVNSQENPAVPGSVISLYATGLGTTTPELADGSITPVPLPVQNTIYGMNYVFPPTNMFSPTPPTPQVAQVSYFGPAPLEVEGLAQINVAVPTENRSPGLMTLQLISTSANALVTVVATTQVWVQ
jgi:uncharacterized protein (TIGR03437 family)